MGSKFRPFSFQLRHRKNKFGLSGNFSICRDWSEQEKGIITCLKWICDGNFISQLFDWTNKYFLYSSRFFKGTFMFVLAPGEGIELLNILMAAVKQLLNANSTPEIKQFFNDFIYQIKQQTPLNDTRHSSVKTRLCNWRMRREAAPIISVMVGLKLKIRTSVTLTSFFPTLWWHKETSKYLWNNRIYVS